MVRTAALRIRHSCPSCGRNAPEIPGRIEGREPRGDSSSASWVSARWTKRVSRLGALPGAGGAAASSVLATMAQGGPDVSSPKPSLNIASIAAGTAGSRSSVASTIACAGINVSSVVSGAMVNGGSGVGGSTFAIGAGPVSSGLSTRAATERAAITGKIRAIKRCIAAG